MCVNRSVEKFGVPMIVIAVLLTVGMLLGESLGIYRMEPNLGYEDLLFDTSYVHTIDIIMPSWDDFLNECAKELYTSCSVVIDGERLDNAGIRAKGNTSLFNVRSIGSSRYSLKIELDYYKAGMTYHGLDKFSLNNMIQDNTYMKDYLSYTLLRRFGAIAPLCSYALVQINGDPWGLFLATEDIDDSFIRRNFGPSTGSLYKPDPIALRRGAAAELMPVAGVALSTAEEENIIITDPSEGAMQVKPEGTQEVVGGPPDLSGTDAALCYLGDNPKDYANIFSTAKTHVTRSDQMRLIRALKKLNEGDELEEVLSVDKMLKMFVVHNYTVNNDSYTGSMIHNYYLYEDAGKLSMIPWDYNIAFGGYLMNSATEAVNDPMDTPLKTEGDGTRPMVDWMLRDPYIEKYHHYFSEFLKIDIKSIIDETSQLISPYAASYHDDPTRFCKHEEYLLAVNTLREFCQLRSKSLREQLNGTISATKDGQNGPGARLIQASSISLNDMGK